MSLFDSFGDVFDTVTDLAFDLAPSLLPGAAAFAATKAFGGTTDEAWLSAGIAGGSSALLRARGGFDDAGTAPVAGGGSSRRRDGVAGGGDGSGGALDEAGIAEGRISGGSSSPRGSSTSGTGRAPGGFLGSLGIKGSDLLQLGGTVLAGLDDTDDKFRERALDLQERRQTVEPITYGARTPMVNRVVQRSAAPGAPPARIIR